MKAAGKAKKRQNFQAATLEHKWRKFRGAFVYFIKCNEFYKIGTANNLIDRVKSLQCGNPYILEIIYAVKVTDWNETENAFHTIFFDKRVNGEWFKLDKQEIRYVRRFIEKLAKKVDYS